jgi:uncharacterized protein YcfL
MKNLVFLLLLAILITGCNASNQVLKAPCQYALQICTYATAICKLTVESPATESTLTRLQTLADSLNQAAHNLENVAILQVQRNLAPMK